MTDNDNAEFGFFEKLPSFGDEQDFVAHIPASISGSKAIFDALYEQLRLPNYFGFNWNALSDCLRDLSWIDQHRVVLVHYDLPNLGRADTFTYLDVLRECINSWKPGESHQLIVLFPSTVQSRVLGILKEGE